MSPVAITSRVMYSWTSIRFTATIYASNSVRGCVQNSQKLVQKVASECWLRRHSSSATATFKGEQGTVWMADDLNAVVIDTRSIPILLRHNHKRVGCAAVETRLLVMQSDGREAKRRRRAESNDTEEGSSIAFQGRRSSAEPQSPREPLHVPPFNAAIEEAKSTSPLLGRTAALYRLLNPSSINTDANYSASAPQNRQFSLPLPLQTQQSLTYRGNTAASASAASATPPPQGNPSTWMETNQQHLQDSSRVPTGIGRSVSSRATATIDKSDKNLWFSQPSGQSIGPDLLGATTIDSQGGMPPLAADLAKFLQNDNSDDTGETTGGSEQEDSKPAARPTTTSNRVSSTTNQSSATPAAAISAFSGEQPYIPQRQSGTLLSSPPRLFAASPAASLAALGEASIQQQPSSPSRTTTRRTRTASAYAAPPASVENAPNSQEARWWDRFRELCDYKDEHGHCQVPLDHTASQHLALARWVKRQRYDLVVWRKKDSSDLDLILLLFLFSHQSSDINIDSWTKVSLPQWPRNGWMLSIPLGLCGIHKQLCGHNDMPSSRNSYSRTGIQTFQGLMNSIFH